LVIPGRIDGEVPQELAGGGIDHADVEVMDEQDHGGLGVGSSDADADGMQAPVRSPSQRIPTLATCSLPTPCIRLENPHWTVYGNFTFCEQIGAMSDETVIHHIDRRGFRA
jgi:hypothetical protein